MKLSSILPWVQKTAPSQKAVLFFGFHEELISYRLKCLQNHYSGQDFQIVHAVSGSEMIDHLHSSQSLFESNSFKKCIVYQNITDTLMKTYDFITPLLTSPHILLLSSHKLNSRSKLVASLQAHKQTAVIPCYDVDLSEISQVIASYADKISLKVDSSARQYLTCFLSAQLEAFFPTMEMLALYGDSHLLSEEDIRNALKGLSSSMIDDFNQHFFLGNLSALHYLLEDVESSDWISLIRQLLQDVTTLMSFQIYQVMPSLLKEFWMRGDVKFSYSRIPLYQKCLKDWSLERCGSVLEQLLRLETRLKSTPPFCLTEIYHLLLSLSDGQRKIRQ